jgi:hypothetical protein
MRIRVTNFTSLDEQPIHLHQLFIVRARFCSFSTRFRCHSREKLGKQWKIATQKALFHLDFSFISQEKLNESRFRGNKSFVSAST